MPTYQYPHESLVDTVHILSNDKGGLRGYLYADNGADTENLRKLKQSLRAKGYECVPTLFNERPVLEVRGFKKPEELMDFLGAEHALTGKPTIAAAEGDVLTRKQKLQHSTLKMAGISYNIGDIAFMYYAGKPIFDTVNEEYQKLKPLEKSFAKKTFAGLKKVEKMEYLDIVAGLGYAAGSYCLTFFGSKDQSINTITDATSKIERFARKEGYQIAPESSIAFVNKKPETTTWGSIKHLIGRYPSESLNSIYVGVGACLSGAALYRGMKPVTKILTTAAETEVINDAFKKAKTDKLTGKKLKGAIDTALEEAKKIGQLDGTTIHAAGKEISKDAALEVSEYAKAKYAEDKHGQFWDRTDVGLGTITASSAILGLAVKEQKRMDGDPKRHGLGAVVDWIREKPLRATGIGYMIATMFHTAATAGKWKNRTINGKAGDYLIARGIFIACNVFSETMMAISSKGHGVGVKPDSSVDESIIATAAELVLRQPADKRETIISQLSGYIASPDVLAVKADKVEAMLRDNITKLDQNPWTKHYVSSAAGEILEVTPTGNAVPVTKAEALEVVKPEPAQQPKPTTTITSPHYVAKQQLMEHAVA